MLSAIAEMHFGCMRISVAKEPGTSVMKQLLNAVGALDGQKNICT